MILLTEEGGGLKADLRPDLGGCGLTKRAADSVLPTPNRPDALTLSLSTGRGDGAMVPQPGRVAHDSVAVGTSLYFYYDANDTLIYLGIGSERVHVAGYNAARVAQVHQHAGLLVIHVLPHGSRFTVAESGQAALKFESQKPAVFRLTAIHLSFGTTWTGA